MSYAKKKKQALSPRNVLANRIAKVVREKQLSKLSVARRVEENGRKFYQVDFGKGKVNVYGTDWVQVQYDVEGNKGEKIFDKGDLALQFFRLAILQGKWKEAGKIPVKEDKEDKEDGKNKEEKVGDK